MNEILNINFDLKDGRKVYIRWVNGPPYLSVHYKMKIAISKLKYLKNPANLDLAKLTALREHMQRYGQIQPITIKHDVIVVDGVYRILAAKDLGWTEIDAVEIT